MGLSVCLINAHAHSGGRWAGWYRSGACRRPAERRHDLLINLDGLSARFTITFQTHLHGRVAGISVGEISARCIWRCAAARPLVDQSSIAIDVGDVAWLIDV